MCRKRYGDTRVDFFTLLIRREIIAVTVIQSLHYQLAHRLLLYAVKLLAGMMVHRFTPCEVREQLGRITARAFGNVFDNIRINCNCLSYSQCFSIGFQRIGDGQDFLNSDPFSIGSKNNAKRCVDSDGFSIRFQGIGKDF